MLLVVDIGNTNITLGLYDEEKLVASYRLTTWFKRTSDEYGFMIEHFLSSAKVETEAIEDVIISSVVPKVMHSFTNSIRRYLKREPLIVGPGMKSGIVIKYDNPKEVGADRIVDAAGAHFYYGGDLLVIDFGTATTFEYIDQEGVYHGGVIMPGVEISAKALSDNAAKLPEIAINKKNSVLVKNTIDAMQSGVYFGYLGACEYIIRRFKEETKKDLKVIATGGLGKIIAQNTKLIDIYDRELTFKGLYYIYQKNRGKKLCDKPEF